MGESVKSIAARIGKSYQCVYREISRNRKPDGRDQPWFAHNQAYQRRRRRKDRRLAVDEVLRAVVVDKARPALVPAANQPLAPSPLATTSQRHLSLETIYEAVYRGLIVVTDRQTLRTGRTYRHKRVRGRTHEGALKQSTNMKSIHDRPAAVETGRQIGHWESQCCCQAAGLSAAGRGSR